MGRSQDEGYWDALSISEVSRLLHIPQSTLRYYEDEGLITPARKESGYRTYSLVSLVELGDVMFYRSIGVPIKSIKSLMDSPAEHTAFAVDAAIGDTVARMQVLTQTLERLSLYNQRIRKYYMVKSRGSRIVRRPEIDALYSFGMKDESSLTAYLEDVATSYGVFYESAHEPGIYADCALRPTQQEGSEQVWSAADHDGKYLECLLRTDYCYAQHNDIARHVEHLASLGLNAGSVAAQYLTFDYCPADQRRYDYYLAWIQIVD